MKINILSPGRFHVLDLARELTRLGHDVRFYSYVSDKRVEKFGFDHHKNSNCVLPLLPLFALRKAGLLKSTKLINEVQDRVTSLIMRPCDVVIAMSGCFCHSLEKAKKQGAKIIIERGSKHILDQKRILESIVTDKIMVPQRNVDDELHDYEIADYISIASQHVKNSFIKHGFDPNRLFVNPYGVDLSMFYPMPEVIKEYDVVMVGNWCYQKGCDLIVEAISNSSYKFLHVGPIGDLPFPKDNPNFNHIDPVDQSKLIKYINSGKVFVLPSRQDGFGMVLTQAMACNLPLVGSIDNGAPDIRELVDIKNAVYTIKDYSGSVLLSAIDSAMQTYRNLNGKPYAGNAINFFSWQSYGKRYDEFLKRI